MVRDKRAVALTTHPSPDTDHGARGIDCGVRGGRGRATHDIPGIARLPDGQNISKRMRQALSRKRILFNRIRNWRIWLRSHPLKGRSYVVTNAGWDAVDADSVGARGNRRAGQTVSEVHRA